MRINNNIPALNTHRLLNSNTNELQKSLERLSSGKRINRASDDAAGLAISQKMDAQVRGLRQASRNSLDGVSLIQTGEGALNEVHAMLQRMRELSVQGSNGVYTEGDLESIANELKELTEQIDKISEDTAFNGIKLLDGENPPYVTDVGIVDRIITDAERVERVKENLNFSGIKNGMKLPLSQDGAEIVWNFTDTDITLNEEGIVEGIGNDVSNVEVDATIKYGGEEEYKDFNLTVVDELKQEEGLNIQIGPDEGQNIKVNMKDFKVSVNKNINNLDSEDGGLYLQNGMIKWQKDFVIDDDGNYEVDENSDYKFRFKKEELTKENFAEAITVYDDAIQEVSAMRSRLGAIQNRLEHTIANLDNTAENLTEAKSRIEDLDMALEMSNFTKLDILQQAGTSMLGQANNMPKTVLQLLQ